MACGCVYHSACAPQSGHCDTCLEAVLAAAEVNGKARNAAIEKAAQQLADGDESIDDVDDDDDGDDGCNAAADAADETDDAAGAADAGERVTVGQVRVAADLALAKCQELVK